jgi:hypothetical protein
MALCPQPIVITALTWLGLAASAEVRAASSVSFTAGQLEFEGLVVEGLALDWEPDPAAGSMTVRAARVRGLAATGPLAKFAVRCPELRIAGDELRCELGRLSGTLGTLGVQDSGFTARRGADGGLRLDFDDFAVAGGRGRLGASVERGAWRADARFDGLDLTKLAAVAKPWVALPADLAVSGRAGGEFRASGRGDALATAAADLEIETLDFSNSGGTLAGEKLAGTLKVDAIIPDAAAAMHARGRLAIAAGQAYSDPVFLDFAAHPATLDFDGRLDTGAASFDADTFTFEQAGIVRAGGTASVDFAGETPIQAARLHLESLALAEALPAYAQPFLVNTAFRDVTGEGTVRGDVEVAAGLPVRATLEVEGAAFGSETAAVSLRGIRGQLRWYDDEARSSLAGAIDDALFESRLAWDSGRLWGLEIGAVDLPFATTGRHFRLLGPVAIPVFDGALAIETLRVRHAGTDEMYVRFDAAIRPISVALLSRAFGWPEFQGTLEGSIPGLQLRQGVVTLDGALDARVFDGRIAVSELRLREPLGKYPRLFANIGIENLDLELVTRTFEFGTITGRLSGYVSDLETFDWMPEAFDAFLFTPPDDRSRRRISQRAVTNLSSIGGGSGSGVAAVLQGGLLRFFDTFGYDRLGLSCRLANDVCIMGGVLPAPGGYYIVKGRALPRIDVIGSQTRVAWTTLVRQLGAMMESEIVVE